MQLKVIKADGSVEQYLHTKVIGTINKALTLSNNTDMCITEQLAEVITYFLYGRKSRSISSSEIYSIIQAVLAETGHENAAEVLNEYHFRRQLRRNRVEVADIDVEDLAGAEMLEESRRLGETSRWDKSRIVKHLIKKYELDQGCCRVIASIVEEKILNMGNTLVSRSLIKQLVLIETAAIQQACEQLQLPVAKVQLEINRADTEVCLTQQQEGLCIVGGFE